MGGNESDSIAKKIDVPGKSNQQTFFVELIKPSHYDDEGYVIQWRRSFSISNSLACLYGLSLDAAHEKILGDDVDIMVDVHDDFSSVIPVKRIIKKCSGPENRGIVCLVGVQTNQYPRALDIARAFRKFNIPVVIGGFHVSGCIAMLPDLPPELQEALDLGISLFAGEAEGRFSELLMDAFKGRLKPVYNYIGQLPELANQPSPFLPYHILNKSLSSDIPVDTSRGCPFKCSFCTVINVQGRKSRFRAAADLERIILKYHGEYQKKHFFFTDDNFARSANWEEILDRLIYLRVHKNIKIRFGIQVDSQAHSIPGFVEKAARAGCNWVFIGIESINPDNLRAANKTQNNVARYREMLQAWRNKKIITMAGYIIGFPEDTPISIERDIKTIQKELPLDIIMFFSLTPLPGSKDYNKMLDSGIWMDGDLNRYDSEHATIHHPKMTMAEWDRMFSRAWALYYTPAHIETLLRRAVGDGIGTGRLTGRIIISYWGIRYEKVHPFQCGAFRIKNRKSRRTGYPLENPFVFYPRRVLESIKSNLLLLFFVVKLKRLVKRIKREG
jgi:pyruvate-formate lyase-activating enzyme